MKPRHWDWVNFDSISSYQDIGLDDLWETVTTENPKRKRYGLDKAEYGINMQRLGRMVRDLVKMADQDHFSLALTAWPADPRQHGSMLASEDEEKEAKLLPWVQGKNMATKVCGYMNIVAFGDITEKGNRVLHLMETERYYAKDQFDCFPNYRLLKPTMPKLFGAIDSSMKKRKPAMKATKKATKKTTRKVKVK